MLATITFPIKDHEDADTLMMVHEIIELNHNDWSDALLTIVFLMENAAAGDEHTPAKLATLYSSLANMLLHADLDDTSENKP